MQACISYTTSPVHNEAYFVKMSQEMEKLGADTICIKDMAGLLLPEAAASLVKELKAHVKIPIHLHTHNTAGTGSLPTWRPPRRGWTLWTAPCPPGQRDIPACHGKPGGGPSGQPPGTRAWT